jgi:hypothetical protein
LPDTAEITRLPLDSIDEGAMPRDRTALDAKAMDELQTSILISGLRQPIEVYRMPPEPGAILWSIWSFAGRAERAAGLAVCRVPSERRSTDRPVADERLGCRRPRRRV